jgi:cysteine-rich repeat protein
MVRLARVGPKAIDACHRTSNRAGEPAVGCNAISIDLQTDYVRAENRVAAIVSGKCLRDDETVRRNYPPCTGECDNILAVVLPDARRLFEENGRGRLGDETREGAAPRCQRAIATGRQAVVKRIVKRSTKCQRAEDRRGTSDFGAVDSACLATAGRAGRRASADIGKACRDVTGASIGTCEPLPDCVVTSAQAVAQELVTLAYGTPVGCGNGAVDFGEECDDGNEIDGDECTNECRVAVCGDGIRWEDVEECDDGNPVDTDDCDTECRLPVCGDGVRAGSEECDDGNDVADDGCTSCLIDPIPCGPSGLRATIVYRDPESANAAGGVMLVGYPAAVDIPGTGAAPTVRERVRNVSSASTGVFLPSDTDADTDGVDDTVRIVFALTETWPPGDFAGIDFACTAGTPVRLPDVTCRFAEASDPFTNAIDPEKLFCGVSELLPIP